MESGCADALALSARAILWPPLGMSPSPLTRKGCAASQPNHLSFESISVALSRVVRLRSGKNFQRKRARMRNRQPAGSSTNARKANRPLRAADKTPRMQKIRVGALSVRARGDADVTLRRDRRRNIV